MLLSFVIGLISCQYSSTKIILICYNLFRYITSIPPFLNCNQGISTGVESRIHDDMSFPLF